MPAANPFATESKLITASGDYTYFSLPKLAQAGLGSLDHLPFSLRVLLESCLRNVDGFIVNEILGDDDNLRLRFSFALQLVDAPSDSAAEHEFRAIMERDYLKAVDATLGAIRQMVADPAYAA